MPRKLTEKDSKIFKLKKILNPPEPKLRISKTGKVTVGRVRD